MTSVPRVFFSSVFEALSRVVGPAEPMVAGVKRLGVDLHKLQPAYPAQTWRDVTDLVGQRLHPGVSQPEAAYKLGQAIVTGYRDTLIGGALLSLLSILGPARVVTRVSRSFRTANNYAEDEVTELGPNHYELWTNEVHVPHLHQGVIQAALEAIGAVPCTVDVVSMDEQGTTYRCRWPVKP